MPLLSNTNRFPVFRSISLAFTTAAIRINLWWNAQYVPETVPGDWHTILLILRATLHFTDAGSEMLNDLPEVALSARSRIEAHPGQCGSRSGALIAVPHRCFLTHVPRVPVIELLLINVPFYFGKLKRCSLLPK